LLVIKDRSLQSPYLLRRTSPKYSFRSNLHYQPCGQCILNLLLWIIIWFPFFISWQENTIVFLRSTNMYCFTKVYIPERTTSPCSSFNSL
jgi:hypothetical protein